MAIKIAVGIFWMGNSNLAFNYFYGYVDSDISLIGKNTSTYYDIPFLKSDNSRGNLISLSEDNTCLIFSRSGLVDFTGMVKFQLDGSEDIYIRVSVFKIDNNGDKTYRFGNAIRDNAYTDHAYITARRILKVNAGEKFGMSYYIPSWVNISDESPSKINLNGEYASSGLMAMYVSYED